MITSKRSLRLAGMCALLGLLAPGAALAHHSNRRLPSGAKPPTPARSRKGASNQTNAASAQAAPANAHLDYFGGRVVSNMQVVQVLYGSGTYLPQVTSTSSPSMATFYQQVLNSSYVDWLSEYDTNITAVDGSPGTNQSIGRGSFVGQFQITPSAANDGTFISDAQIQSELAAQIAAGNLPAPTTDAAGNNNTYYAVFFPREKAVSANGIDDICSGACAYHGTIADAAGHEIYYGVHPDNQPGSGCGTACSDPTPFEALTRGASHELVETITDAEVGLAATVAKPVAWFDPVNAEIGDICVTTTSGSIAGSDGQTYTVQREWSNIANQCITDFTPTFYFSAFVVFQSTCAPADAQLTIEIERQFGFSDDVTLSASGLPAGASATFAPNPVGPGQSSVLTVHFASTPAPGIYSFPITGTSGSIARTLTADLDVSTAAPSAPTLTAPHDGAKDILLLPNFRWTPSTQVEDYVLEVATDRSFNNLVGSRQVFQESIPARFVTGVLNPDTDYFWRVRAENPCGQSAESATFTFHTLHPVRLGNNTEDITFVPSGPLAGTIAIVDGLQVLAAPLDDGKGKPSVRELFRTSLPASGITYLPEEGHFALLSQADPFDMPVYDTSGNFVEARPVQYASGQLFLTEGLAFLPSGAPKFAGDILVAANFGADTLCAGGAGSSLQVLTPDGQGVGSILPAEPLACQYIAGVAFQAPDHLLATVGNEIWTLDFSGNVVSGPVPVSGSVDVEGITQIPSGGVVTADYAAGQLTFLNADLSPARQKNRSAVDYRIGPGLSGTFGVAWDSRRSRYLLTSQFTRGDRSQPQVFSLSSLSSALGGPKQIANLPANGFALPLSVAYLPDEDTIAVADRASAVLGVFNQQGVLHDELDLSALAPTAAMDYVPATRQFVVQGNGVGLTFLSRGGSLVGSINPQLGHADAAAFFVDSTGPKLLLHNDDPFVDFAEGLNVIDLDGQFFGGFPSSPDYAVLGLSSDPTDMAAITSGPNAGEFAAVDSRTSSIVVFQLR